MKVLFVGPTLSGAAEMAGPAMAVRPPARQGDIHAAVREGATAIGLVDGVFEYVAPVWHKEILFALSLGVQVLGSSSMGALRAAECDRFGMIGVGSIYRRFASGGIEDDADIAQLHAPGELGYAALTVPLVNVHATLAGLLADRSISRAEFAAIEKAAAVTFFKDRTLDAIAAVAMGLAAGRRAQIRGLLGTRYVDQKRADAMELLARLQALDDCRACPPAQWRFQATTIWAAAFRSE
ncbi:hypothetical protein DFR52_101245 [Hoeflea marina]|uniref:TfuA-like core domain-containing protein n=1 Tax=Hoeflea marina TaxID=274592 RepID=A0A317PSH5_9HYPH|nr:TfuA-like protein [Hoeflea marina]PWW03564.1 hypothetical protein DFR52_101245 [Hoeflea marina]